MSADRKYTDRDVRENQSFYLTVIDYLENYEGEFDYLVDMKMRVAMDRDLTVPMVRGVLNCMRHDPRVSHLPEPLPPQEGKVLQMPTKNKKNKKRRNRKPCDIVEFHKPHGGFGSVEEDDPYEYCSGKFAINRSDFQVDAILKVPYVTAVTGALIHKASEAWYMWRVLPHEEGWRYMSHGNRFDGDPDFYVRTICMYPRIIENGWVFDQWKIDEVLAEPIGSSAKTRTFCKRCFPQDDQVREEHEPCRQCLEADCRGGCLL